MLTKPPSIKEDILVVLKIENLNILNNLRLLELQIVLDTIVNKNEGILLDGAYEIIEDDPNGNINNITDKLYGIFIELNVYYHIFKKLYDDTYQLGNFTNNKCQLHLHFYKG